MSRTRNRTVQLGTRELVDATTAAGFIVVRAQDVLGGIGVVEVHLVLAAAEQLGGVLGKRRFAGAGDHVVQMSGLPERHLALREGLVVEVAHEGHVAGAAALHGPRQLHVEALLLQHVHREGGHGSAHGMAGDEHILGRLLRRRRRTSARLQGCHDGCLQGLNPRVQGAIGRFAALAVRVVERDHRHVFVHVAVLQVVGAAEDEDAGLGGHEVGRSGVCRVRAADERGE
eukprot:CAMPEP_0177567006 /NCGR_PEP_ID=MMETSP0369-20130122/74998_1 /TAXON_ID=447022 ORGANISM="Scrippsiella hangoei-like, Strain SHHI-4" /NCGR_SAMPLE_ID=MMETSP0369 /ASSEMBLY_ACC=CAM_ASM_000364 /LENGTH=228 /DNA_ID=CAMNT_0019054491 /DNA_START=189 /DNA_END=872 /DNA_ORIENTATION=-